jgi:hypothetical protein
MFKKSHHAPLLLFIFVLLLFLLRPPLKRKTVIYTISFPKLNRQKHNHSLYKAQTALKVYEQANLASSNKILDNVCISTIPAIQLPILSISSFPFTSYFFILFLSSFSEFPSLSHITNQEIR